MRRSLTGERVRARSHAFTLVELLVVLAIIAVLASLLFPVVARSRDSGRQTVCISNLRQLGAAFRMYMWDWDDVRPDSLQPLVRSYVSDPKLLLCPSDATGNYAYLNWGITISPPVHWPYPVSYDYFSGYKTDAAWNLLESLGPRVGYVLDRNHGYVWSPLGPGQPMRAPQLEGEILRLEMDGSVVHRVIVIPPNRGYFYWHFLVYNPGVPDPPDPDR